MAEKISQMPAVDALVGDELLETVQNGANKKVTPEQIISVQKRHDQPVPTQSITFIHSLNKIASIRICTVDGIEVEAEIIHSADLSTVIINFSSDFIGFIVAD